MKSKTLLYSSLRPRAVALRGEGKTFSEIQSEIGAIPKGTLSGWLKNIELTEDQKIRIQKIKTESGSLGRQIGAWKNHQKRLNRLAVINELARQEYVTHLSNSLFLAGLTLYLAEGTKKSEVFNFMNSDSKLIECMVIWITTIGNIPFEELSFRLYIHELYAHENCEAFWMDKLGASKFQMRKTIYKPTIRKYKKNPTYKGCLRIEVKGSDLYWKTMAWRDCFYESLRR